MFSVTVKELNQQNPTGSGTSTHRPALQRKSQAATQSDGSPAYETQETRRSSSSANAAGITTRESGCPSLMRAGHIEEEHLPGTQERRRSTLRPHGRTVQPTGRKDMGSMDSCHVYTRTATTQGPESRRRGETRTRNRGQKPRHTVSPGVQ